MPRDGIHLVQAVRWITENYLLVSDEFDTQTREVFPKYRQVCLRARNIKWNFIYVIFLHCQRQTLCTLNIDSVTLAVERKCNHERRSSYDVAIFMRNCRGLVALAIMIRLSA